MKKNKSIFYLVFIITLFSCSLKKDPIILLVGKYNESGEKGISLFEMNQKDGSLNLVSESHAGPNPAYLCISKKRSLIYAANEVMNFNDGNGGGVTTLKYDAIAGTTEKIGELAVPNGSPCFISLSPNEDYLLLANYTGGSIAVIKLNGEGIPEIITDSVTFESVGEKNSHAHMISFDPAGKRVYLTDLGLDRIVVYDFDAVSGKLLQLQNGIVCLTKGSGPRHFAFSLDGTKMYVICELNSTISVFNIDVRGVPDSMQVVSTLRDDFKGENSCADIHIGKGGDFLYGSNRGENTIVTFRIGSDGFLNLAGHTSCGGDWPRNFVIDHSGNYILVGNQRSGNISVFDIDKKTGIPVESGKVYKINSPACLKFLD